MHPGGWLGRRPGRAGLLAAASLGAGAASLGGGAAWAQLGGGYSSLPATVTDTRVSDLRGQLEQYLPGLLPRTTGPAFLVNASLGVDAGVTDNALRVERPRRADVFTVISPNLRVSGDTSRLKVNLNYAPLASVYAQNPSQTRFDQYGNGTALATLVPEAVFLDLRGSVTQQSRTGGYGQTRNTLALNRNDQVQTAAFSVTPYAEHRFGGLGTARLGYSLARTIESGYGSQNNLNTTQALVFNNGFGAIGNLTTQRERASFVTGENLGRVNDTVVLEAVQYSGVAAYRGAHRNQATNDIGYAVTRTVTALAGFGYQDLRFNGVPGVRISEPIWSVGGRLTPNPDSSITITYGRRDGFNAAAVDGAYSPTARTRVFVRYATGLTTDAEEQQNLLATTNVGPTGLLVDSVTGAPVSSSSGAFGTQNGLYRLRRFSITGLLLLNRDSVSVSLEQDDRQSINTVPAGIGGTAAPTTASNSGIIGTLAWEHELSPALSSSASLSYGVDDNGNLVGTGSSGSQRTVQTSLALNYVFTETLTGSARYLFTDRSGGGRTGQANIGSNAGLNAGLFGFGQTGQNLTENLLLVGLRKSF
jgi:uncharacterized protein (PEP-CTERM system associated)